MGGLEKKLHGHDVVVMGLGGALGYYTLSATLGGPLGIAVGAGAAYLTGEIADKYI